MKKKKLNNVAAINKTSIQSREHLFSTNRLVFSISKYFIINGVGHTAEQHSHCRPPGRNDGLVGRGVNRQSSAPNGQISAPVGHPSLGCKPLLLFCPPRNTEFRPWLRSNLIFPRQSSCGGPTSKRVNKRPGIVRRGRVVIIIMILSQISIS